MKILDQILVIPNRYYPDTSHKRWRRIRIPPERICEIISTTPNFQIFVTEFS